MNKFSLLKILTKNGDSTITLKDEPAIVVTTDFSTPYIKNKKRQYIPMEKSNIVVWSWTDDSFRSIPVASVKTVKPLSDILDNKRDG